MAKFIRLHTAEPKPEEYLINVDLIEFIKEDIGSYDGFIRTRIIVNGEVYYASERLSEIESIIKNINIDINLNIK